MTEPDRIVIIGGHGKIALLAAGKLKAAGYEVVSVIRDPDQSDDVRAAGGIPVVLDIETADVDALASALSGARGVVFSAGAGGGNPARTVAVDYEAATRTMDAADRAGVPRFVIVSYDRAGEDVHRVDPDEPFYTYAKAKHDADAYLRGTALDYTILGPGRLTTEPASGGITRAGDVPQARMDERRVTSRETVAEVMTHVLVTGAASRETVNFYDGGTPIGEALSS